MNEAVLTLGMWTHVFANALVCFSPTRNPIWGELRLMGVIVATAVVWIALAMVV